MRMIGLPQARPCTQRAGIPSTVLPHQPDLSAVPFASSERLWMLLLEPNTPSSITSTDMLHTPTAAMDASSSIRGMRLPSPYIQEEQPGPQSGSVELRYEPMHGLLCRNVKIQAKRLFVVFSIF
ncbi:unnamed protein product [Pleuronectes platessa]|uniref:Uncharacterized protein n=1 Tax=Pleuronectes platessa TaxID=8262 RepID=A0A9N7Z3W7_PLEPL|nr:unnamed protein product [Pleuronectes platessa]